jgi:hypothetical protein
MFLGKVLITAGVLMLLLAVVVKAD